MHPNAVNVLARQGRNTFPIRFVLHFSPNLGIMGTSARFVVAPTGSNRETVSPLETAFEVVALAP